ncbi:MAG: 2-(1,2-epoxy,2-dihydrophenyl)acetyl-CoA isomerase [Gaiellaceae bacterium]|nr:2-(1,2-epoxy,2-dihydrophenyl)acetyl-CoA isomerase [Gaiellaceae bacterium]
MSDPILLEPIRLERRGDVAELVLNRPERRNALDKAAAAALTGALDELEKNPPRALLLRGEGKGFCAGRDLSDAEPLTEDAEAILRDGLNPLIARLAALPYPTVAAVQGPALGTGLGLALACDLLLVGEGAKIGSPFAAIGAVLDSGAHHFLASRIGPHRTLELLYTGRFLNGKEAVEWGIANQVHPDDGLLDAARALVTAAAAGPTSAFAASKSILARVAGEGLSLAEVLAAEAAAQGAATRTHDYGEGITAFQEKRKPTFTGH